MIKIEVNKGEVKVKTEGLGIIVLSEMGMVIDEFYKILKNNYGEGITKKLMKKMAEDCFLTEEEREKRSKKLKKKRHT